MTLLLNVKADGIPIETKNDISSYLLTADFQALLIAQENYRSIIKRQFNNTAIYFIRSDLEIESIYVAEQNTRRLKVDYTLTHQGKVGLLNCMSLKCGKDVVFWVFIADPSIHIVRTKLGLRATRGTNFDVTSPIETNTVNEVFAINSSADGNSTQISLNNLEIKPM